MESFLKDNWLILITQFAGFIIWCVRLEGKSSFCSQRIEKLDHDNEKIRMKIDLIDSQWVKELTQIRESIARIEGRLSIQNESK
jgi:hypothetical protein